LRAFIGAPAPIDQAPLKKIIEEKNSFALPTKGLHDSNWRIRRHTGGSSTPASRSILIMSIISEFKEFAVKGNVIDLAVGVIIGAAFGKIVDSLVADIIMPIVGLVFGKLDFSNLYLVLGSVPAGVPSTLADLKKAGVPVLAYGNFITIAVNFVILAFIIFMMVKQINKLRKHQADAPAAPVAPPEDIALLREIRDSLKRP
jgi:large conductance mechanosensitive channel